METPIPQVRVTIPHALRSLCTAGAEIRKGELLLQACDIRGLLAELERLHPQIHVRICDERGQPRPHINIFVNDEHIRARGGLDTSLTAGQRVMILPAVSGG